ncbi:MAG: hypothetical protein AMS26_15555 [Bacteroides sp. SM23_62]|nr:MAG: hypothetical protein AMS26_15555 [Bacteroides sp. SM23_62]
MLDKRQIENNIKWLLKNGSLPVKYLTYRDLLREDAHSKSMKGLFTEVEKCHIVEEIFSKQRPDGSWCSGGSWALPPSYLLKSGYTPVSPKYVTTSWILPILGDMGFTIQDKRVKKACDYILSYQSKNGFISESHSKKYDVRLDLLKIEPCRFSIILIGLGKVGACSDPRVINAYNLFIKWQRNDGGWVSEQHFIQQNWTRSCPFASYHAAMALYSTRNETYKDELIKVLKFILWHLSTKRDDEIKRFFYHGHSIVHELLMFSELNIGLKEKVVQTILEWLMTMYQPNEGCFQYTGKSISKYSRQNDDMDARVAKYRLFHLIEDDWLTYHITRIVVNVLKHEIYCRSR